MLSGVKNANESEMCVRACVYVSMCVCDILISCPDAVAAVPESGDIARSRDARARQYHNLALYWGSKCNKATVRQSVDSGLVFGNEVMCVRVCPCVYVVFGEELVCMCV